MNTFPAAHQIYMKDYWINVCECKLTRIGETKDKIMEGDVKQGEDIDWYWCSVHLQTGQHCPYGMATESIICIP